MGTSPYDCRQLDPGSLDRPVTGLTHRVAVEQPETLPETSLTAQVVRMLCDAWRLRVDGSWTTALPAEPEHGTQPAPDQVPPERRIHLSATPRSAGAMLERAVPVLATRGVVFTFAADLEAVRGLGGRDCDPRIAGRVLTAYPGPNVDIEQLAGALHQATEGLPGPRVLSARPYRPRSLVHLGPDQAAAAEAPPDPFGLVLPDQRRPGTPTLLAARYLIGQTLRRTPSSGIYLAVDTHASGGRPGALADDRAPDTRVVIEHARRHADIDELGQDARARLLHQARILRRLHGSVAVPEPLRVFALDQDLFLVERYLSGVSFARWVAAHSADGHGVPVAIALPMARRLLRLVAAVHDAGVVLRALDPSGVLVAQDGRPMLVNLEAACEIGETGRRVLSGSCRAPEQSAGSAPPGAAVTEDLYGLGGLLFLMATGSEPVLPTHDDGYDRQERLTGWLRAAAAHREAARVLAPATLGLLADDPAHRCDLVTAAARLEPRHSGPLGRERTRSPGPRRLLDDGLSHLADTMTLCGDRLWPDLDARHPLSVRNGAAGVLSVFLADLRAGNPGYRDLALTVANRLAKDPDPAAADPGLYTGQAGIAWTLADAARVLAEPVLLARADQLARGLPSGLPATGLMSGLAGVLLTHLKLYALTERDESAELAGACVRAIRRAAVPTRSGPLWPEAGTTHYGFAHGVAGIGYALLVAGRSLGDDRASTLAMEAGGLLCEVAAFDRDDRVRWPVGPDNPRRRSHWDTGASGIGSFLLRLWVASGQTTYARYARSATEAVLGASWASATGACQGIAGDGQFLLDAAELLPDPRCRELAEDLVALLSARHARRRGRGLVADDTGASLSSGYGAGLAGVVAYLLRLQHPGPRPFMLDELIGTRPPKTIPNQVDRSHPTRL